MSVTSIRVLQLGNLDLDLVSDSGNGSASATAVLHGGSNLLLKAILTDLLRAAIAQPDIARAIVNRVRPPFGGGICGP